ncbi:glucokinase [Arthrobacter sp. Hiyo8]|nr:glucokinase [Arthrobacter sp. Hiyo8]
MMYVVGVDLGGRRLPRGCGADGEVLFSEQIPTLNRDGGDAILRATAALVGRLMRRAAGAGIDVVRVGVGSAGVIDAVNGEVVSATDAILGWAGTGLTAGLAQLLGLPRGSVSAVNDVHAHALGEAWRGAAAGSSSSLMVAFGTGVGGSFVLDGAPVLGHHYVGGHVGHFASPYAYHEGKALPCVCGGSGHVEAIASGPAIHESFVRFGGSPRSRTLVRCLPWCTTEIVPIRPTVRPPSKPSGRRGCCGQAIGGLVNILDPETVVVSGVWRMREIFGGNPWNVPCARSSWPRLPTFPCFARR